MTFSFLALLLVSKFKNLMNPPPPKKKRRKRNYTLNNLVARQRSNKLIDALKRKINIKYFLFRISFLYNKIILL